ncbi:MAG: polyprenol monophosphomannose synthase [Chloroflexi bacterium]|nr:MAG: polyprenol monophosphomannose synthase [Chloroflexota bacterium]
MPKQSSSPKVSIVLPTFNEAGNIKPLIERTLAALGNTPGGVEVVVVDDNSPDGTWRLVEQIAARDARVRLIHRTTESGLTSAISRGIREARGRWVGWMDCDLSMPPEDWPQLAAALAGGADLAVGSRYVPGGGDVAHGFSGRLFSRIINLYAGLVLDWSIKDYTSGFILGKKEVFDQIDLRGDYGEYCIDLLYRARRAGFTIRELPYLCVPREAGQSKTATNVAGYLARGVNYVTTVLKLRFR